MKIRKQHEPRFPCRELLTKHSSGLSKAPEWGHQVCRVEEPVPQQGSTIRQLPMNKKSSGELRSPAMQWNRIPENNLTNRKEEQLHLASIIPAPRRMLLNIKRELPAQKEFSSMRKEESGVSYQLSQTFGAPQKRTYFSFTPLRNRQS